MAGVPVIVSDIPEHTLITRLDAPKFRNKNHIDLAAKLRLVLSQPDRHKVEALRLSERVSREFNWDHISDKIEDLYAYNFEQRKKMVQKLA